MQRGELAVAPHEETQEAGTTSSFKYHEAGSAGYTAGGLSADVGWVMGWVEHEESKERAVTAVVEDSADGIRAASLLPEASSYAGRRAPSVSR